MSCDEFIGTFSAGALPSVQLAEHYERCARCARLWHAEALLRGARANARPAPRRASGYAGCSACGSTRRAPRIRRGAS